MNIKVYTLLFLVSVLVCCVDCGKGRRPSFAPCTQSKTYFTVNYNPSNTSNPWTVVSGVVSSGVATLVYCAEVNVTGWDVVQITTNSAYPDDIQSFGAGFIEAAVTHESIRNAILTTNMSYGGAPLPVNVQEFVLTQDQWIRSNAAANKASSPYWYQVSLVLAQFDGLYKGYSLNSPYSLEYIELLSYSLGPELGDIFSHFQVTQNKLKPVPGASHCSVLVKVSKDGNHLFAAHDTWSSYTGMLRQFKTYNFHFRAASAPRNPISSEGSNPEIPEIPGSSVSFSSYPGSLQSGDDYYLTSASLVVMETTNDVMNDTLYQLYINTSTVSEWIRIIVANRLASGGRTWSAIYSQFNSGTYNNQWQVVDYKLFTPGKPLLPNTLWIVEQIPGFVVSADKTDVLASQGYWPSYNIPYFPFIYNISGYPAYYKQYGNMFSYDYCARANIFRRDQQTVQDVPSMKKIMRYNKFQSDALSLQDACRGISARCDLNTPWSSNNTLNGWAAFGGIDSKMVTENSVKNGQTEAVNGPTWDSQPPFAWTDTWNSNPHFGQPQVFDFDWVTMSPISLPTK